MILFTISNTFAAKLFATKLSIMSCLFSHSLLNILAHLPPQYNCFEKCRGSWKNWRPGISYSNPFPVLIPICEIANSGMGREWKNPFPQFGNGKGMKKNFTLIWEREGNKKTFPKFRNGKGMKKSIPIIWEWKSEVFILGNGREQEFPLTPVRDGGLTLTD